MNISDFQAFSNACRNIRSQLGVIEKALEKEKVELNQEAKMRSQDAKVQEIEIIKNYEQSK